MSPLFHLFISQRNFATISLWTFFLVGHFAFGFWRDWFGGAFLKDIFACFWAISNDLDLISLFFRLA